MSEAVPDPAEEHWITRLKADAAGAVAELFAEHHPRLRRTVAIRMDPRLNTRIDPSDVLQDAYLRVSAQAAEFAAGPTLPVFVWLRLQVGRAIVDAYRKHIGTQKHDLRQEVRLDDHPPVSTDSLVGELVGRGSSPGTQLRRDELRQRLDALFGALDPIDREVLVLRHFEDLSNGEVAATLGLSKTAASNRYVRALDRLRELMADAPDFFTPDGGSM
jgi:RNA polymerase sigma-70 factor, ECF subfamily